MTALSSYYLRPPSKRHDSLTGTWIVSAVVGLCGGALGLVGWLAGHTPVMVGGLFVVLLALAALLGIFLLRQEARDRERHESELVTPDCGHRTMRRHLRWRGVGTCCAACAARQRLDLIRQQPKGAA